MQPADIATHWLRLWYRECQSHCGTVNVVFHPPLKEASGTSSAAVRSGTGQRNIAYCCIPAFRHWRQLQLRKRRNETGRCSHH